MSLAKDILNGKTRLEALCVPCELAERKAVLDSKRVKLQRTFSIKFEGVTIRYWRVIAPSTHRNYQSDLSIEGLKEWRIIK